MTYNKLFTAYNIGIGFVWIVVAVVDTVMR